MVTHRYKQVVDLLISYFEWSNEITSLTLKHVLIRQNCKLTDEIIFINLLEFVIKIINYAAVMQARAV